MSTSGPAAATTGPDRSASERLVELAVYVPVGLLSLAREELPGLIAAGRRQTEQRLDAARFVGRLAIEQGRRMLRQRVQAAAGVPSTRQNTVVADTVDRTPAEAAPGGSPRPAPSELAIDHYDSLAAAQVVDLLASLSVDELAAVERYETAHRNRRTILGKIAQLRG